MKLFDNRFSVLEKGLNAYTKRAEALANNIANVNTPNYKRKDVQFESLLNNSLNENSSIIVGMRTDKKHLKIGGNSIDNVEALEITEDGTVMRNDGNNVDIEKEKIEQAKNNIRYQFAANRLSANFNILKNSIKGR